MLEHERDDFGEGLLFGDGDDGCAHVVADSVGAGGGVEVFDAVAREPLSEDLWGADEGEGDSGFASDEVAFGEDAAELSVVVDDGEASDVVLEHGVCGVGERGVLRDDVYGVDHDVAGFHGLCLRSAVFIIRGTGGDVARCGVSGVEEVGFAASGEVADVGLPLCADVFGRVAVEEGVVGVLVCEEGDVACVLPVLGEECEEGVRDFDAGVYGLEGAAVCDEEVDTVAGCVCVGAGARGEVYGDAPESGDVAVVEVCGEFARVDPRGPEEFEGGVGAASDGEVGEFEESDSGVEECLCEGSHAG
ncbi:MAG: hypothetical protein RMJ43_07185 [Chloroherpetonaceae bacterium]|nr:hypothetical protein [Chloroherpetonaceae bacterium]